MKTLIITLLLSTLLSSFYAQQIHSRKTLAKDVLQQPKVTDEKSYTNFSDAEPIGITSTYDYWGNSIVKNRIAVYENEPHLVSTGNLINNPSESGLFYSYKSQNEWEHIIVDSLEGFPQIDIALTGNNISSLGIVSFSNLYLYDGSGNFSTYEFESDPSLQFSNENIFLASSGSRVEYSFYKTTDMGSSFIQWSTVSDFHPDPIFWLQNGGVDIDMFKSPNEQYIGYLGTNANYGQVFDGVPQDSADNIWIIYSTDAGETWTGETIGYDGIINYVEDYHTPNFAPLFENFSQIKGCVGNDGVFHIVANGYGVVFDDPEGSNIIGSSFPVLYWNSDERIWRSISEMHIDTMQSILDFYPGNNLGQSYPQIACSEDGSILFASWTGPQLTNTGEIDTADANGFYWLNLYSTVSIDGENWQGTTVINDDPEVSENYGHSANLLEDIGDGTFRAHITFLNDLSPGANVFGEGEVTENPVMYTYHDIIFSDVEDKGNLVVNSFKLEQNYPNPFNPATTISYSIPVESNVNLKIYDILGNEIAELVNTQQKAGKYEVEFSANEEYSSGIYFYKLTAGKYSSTKKMILLK